MRVLLVEDNKAAREALDVILTSKGHWVKTAKSAEEAMAVMLLGTCPDILVVDYYLPKENGVDLINAIRSHPKCKHIPVILVTAAADAKVEEIFEKMPDMGDVQFLRKPLDIEELVSMLHSRRELVGASPCTK